MKLVSDNILIFFGDNQHDYRSLLANQNDVQLDNINIPYHRMVKMEQIAQDIIVEVNESDAGAGFIEGKPEIAQADGIITQAANLFLCVRTADCYPVILYDVSKKVIAVVHSGREGTRLNIVGKMINKMINHYHCELDNIKLIIGAGITEPHYELDKQTLHQFYQSITLDLGINLSDLEANKSRHLNILKFLFLQISHAKIPLNNIQYIPHCTYENTHYFSYRRDKTHNRQISVIGIIS